jgi:hypothetical protein
VGGGLPALPPALLMATSLHSKRFFQEEIDWNTAKSRLLSRFSDYFGGKILWSDDI